MLGPEEYKDETTDMGLALAELTVLGQGKSVLRRWHVNRELEDERRKSQCWDRWEKTFQAEEATCTKN